MQLSLDEMLAAEMKAAVGTRAGSEDLGCTKHKCPKAATKCRLQDEVRRRREGGVLRAESAPMVGPGWGSGGLEPCQLAGALRALSGLSPLLLALALQVQPCKLFSLHAKRPRDQAESAPAQAVRHPHLLLLTNTKHHIPDICCLTPQPSHSQSTQTGEA